MEYYNKPQIVKASELKEGDIIFTDLAQENVYIDYPYIVTLIKNEKVYACKTTQVHEMKKTLFRIQAIGNGEFKTRELVAKRIPADIVDINQQVIKIGKVSESELNYINKSIYYRLFDEEFSSIFPYTQEDITYTNGPLDVIEYEDKKYVICGQTANEFVVFDVVEGWKVRFGIDGVGYGIKRDERSSLPRDQVYKVLKIIKPKDAYKHWKKKEEPALEVEKLKTKKEKEKNEANIKIAQRGDIIVIGRNRYLVFGEYKEYSQIYKLYGSTGNSSLFKVSLNGNSYRTEFKGKLILKNVEYEIVDHISDDDLKELGKKRKSIQKNETNYIRPLMFNKKNTISLSFNQKKFLNELKEHGFTEDEIISIMITLCQETDLELILDYMTDVNNKYIIKKEDIIEKVLEIVRS